MRYRNIEYPGDTRIADSYPRDWFVQNDEIGESLIDFIV